MRHIGKSEAMATKNQVLDMSPLGMIFTVLATAEDTKGKSLDLQWKLLPGCNMKDPWYISIQMP